MVNEEILGGLKLALSKGESLKQAMISFYNAGYKKEEIEEAARASQKERFEEQKAQQPKPEQLPEPKQPLRQKPKKKLIQKVSKYEKKIKIPKPKIIKQEPISPQKVSGYGEKPKPKGKLITLLLIFLLLFLLGILAAVFFFREELVGFINNLFG